ncbi:MAG: HAMP domain-containing histidine kinase [Terrimonas sp.]|nr:HAMP domain-containing histidine kinase [Terrimonas sp.]OJY93250.1 MAG: two-component sensor histidine kinase [Sphingobacteriales bacterium 40-81]
MKIRNKITIYFSVTILLITGFAFLLIYFLYAYNREEEFQMRQKEKIGSTLQLLAQIKQTDNELVEEIDRLTINSLFDEKLLLFNDKKELIYSSLDDTPVPFSITLLSSLNAGNRWIETKDGLYDVVGVYIESNGRVYYGLSKAFDSFGYAKLRYLRFILFITFMVISIIIILVSFFLSGKITQPLAAVTQKISHYNFDAKYEPIYVNSSKNEVSILARQFNKLMQRMNEVYSFQKHAIHHISHELKTPIAVLVSNFERIEKETDPVKIKSAISIQKEDTKNLGEIINALLEIAKAESGTVSKQDHIRIDEMIFDVADELQHIHPDFLFSIEYEAEKEHELTLPANAGLLRSAFVNLMQNAVAYSNDNMAGIKFTNVKNAIRISIENRGKIITEKEHQYLFQHFVRGENSKGKRGFGLGLVLVHKIIALHNGTVTYKSRNNSSNIFTITLPLS